MRVLLPLLFLVGCASLAGSRGDGPWSSQAKAAGNPINECLARGGRWRGSTGGRGDGQWHCAAPDAGKECRDNGECKSGLCRADKLACGDKTYEPRMGTGPAAGCDAKGLCSGALPPPSGCVGSVIAGKFQNKCFN